MKIRKLNNIRIIRRERIKMDDNAINKHYGISGILNSILDGLEFSG